MALIASLVAALTYGLSDFVGGAASRHSSAWPVAFLGSIGASVTSLVVAPFWPISPPLSELGVADVGWGVLAGLGSGFGSAFLYRGFALGRMGVVAPISAVGAAALPLALGVALGERPAMLAWLGIAIALPGIWLVSKEEAESDTSESHLGPAADSANDPSRATAAGVVDGIAAGLGFGLMFVAAGQISDASGLWPIVVVQAVAALCVLATALAMGASAWPTQRTQAWGLLAGTLAMLALVAFFLATQTGLLSLAAVVTSLYPAATIALAVVFLKERAAAAQWMGMALCLAGVGLISLA